MNIIYNGLTTLKEKRLLLFVLFILTVFPGILNTFDGLQRIWAPLDIIQQGKLILPFPVLPKFGVGIYPITYYFVGAYLCDRQEEIVNAKWNNWMLLFIMVIILVLIIII